MAAESHRSNMQDFKKKNGGGVEDEEEADIPSQCDESIDKIRVNNLSLTDDFVENIDDVDAVEENVLDDKYENLSQL